MNSCRLRELLLEAQGRPLVPGEEPADDQREERQEAERGEERDQREDGEPGGDVRLDRLGLDEEVGEAEEDQEHECEHDVPSFDRVLQIG